MHRFNTIPDLVESTFKTYANNKAYTCLGHTLTFKELDYYSACFAHYLQNTLQMQSGDKIAIQLPNILQYPIVLYGAVRAGLIIVNVNPLYTATELAHQLNDSETKALVVLENIAHTAASIIDNTPVEHIIVTKIGDIHPFFKRQCINFAIKYIKKIVPPYAFKNTISFLTTLKHGKTHFKTPEVTPQDIFILQYTGGTTGVAKGAMLTHKNLTSSVWQMFSHMPHAYMPGIETFAACLPLYHVYAFNLHALNAFSYGEHNVLIPNPRDLHAVTKAFTAYPISVVVGITTLFTALCNHKPFHALDFRSLKLTSSGGMALTRSVADKWKNMTGCDIVEGYGLTEASPIISANTPDKNNIGTIGFAVPQTDIILIDGEENTVDKGEAGELCVKGPQVMAGYWKKPDETAHAFTQTGYLKTGDIAVQSDDGILTIVDRKKDMIIVSGFNVYPNEIERVVLTHPNVVDCAAIGLPDEKCGERIKLFVISNDKSLDTATLKSFCQQELTRYKCPKDIEFRKSLPRSTIGKVLKRALKDECLDHPIT